MTPLVSTGPHAALREQMQLYGQFVGEWDVEVTNYPEGAEPVRARGEWIFEWALEGRAVQDVWIVPPRAERDPADLAAGPYGTTIRYYVPGEDVWRIVWMNPVGDSISTMTARRVGDEIVQDGIDDDGGAYRWVFLEIEPDRFRWRSEDRGADGSWTLRQEMVVTRKP